MILLENLRFHIEEEGAVKDEQGNKVCAIYFQLLGTLCTSVCICMVTSFLPHKSTFVLMRFDSAKQMHPA